MMPIFRCFFVSFHRLRNILCFSVCFGGESSLLLSSYAQQRQSKRWQAKMSYVSLASPIFLLCFFIPLITLIPFSPPHILLCYIICSFFSHTFFAQFFFCRFTAECFLEMLTSMHSSIIWMRWLLLSSLVLGVFPHSLTALAVNGISTCNRLHHTLFVYLDLKMSSGNNKPKQAR